MKSAVSQKLAMSLLTALAHLPLRALYLIADIIFFIAYYMVRYRRTIVRKNIAECFPGKSGRWRRRTERQFYRHLSDLTAETIKLLHISDAEICRRITFDGLEQLNALTGQGRDVAIYFAHCGNWEWAPSMTLHMSSAGNSTAFCQVYRPLRSALADAIMLRIRSRFGSLSFPKATALRHLLQLRRQGIRTVTGFMSDQKPSHNDPTVTVTFLGRPTAFISGTETLIRRLGMSAVYWDMTKPSRGHYHLSCRHIDTSDPDAPFGHITRQYAVMLEQTIMRNPTIWLWSHNRWKNPVNTNAKTTSTP